MNQHELGIFGEQLAKKSLQENGYEIVYSNYRFRHVELDLVCKKDSKLIVVEVKTRFSNAIGEPWQAVTKSKQRQLIRAANFYIEQFDIDLDTRFDVVSIIHNDKETKIEHIIDAFTP